tara:strand:- start:90 stop:299 length:210 start_codon:yes stop_codon:yes gene_type:complete
MTNQIVVGIYLISFVALLGATFAFMFRMMTSTLMELDKKPRRPIHPEMRDVENGEELLVFKGLKDADDK